MIARGREQYSMGSGVQEDYVSVTGVSKTFVHDGARVPVLEEVGFTIAKGEFCAIVGPSGCGKSSLLRVIDGLIPADTGSVHIDGREVTGPSPDVGFVFQQFNLLPWRTVLRNVLFGLENLRLSRTERQERARHWLSLVGLSGFERYYPRQLSGGMQQRVSLARTMARNPSLVLMDEPFGALDALTRMYLQEEIQRIWQESVRTGLFVTHDIDEAIFLADRVFVMSNPPAHFVDVLEVPFSHPRVESVRSSPEFGRLKSGLWELLAGSVRRSSSGERQ